MRHTTTIMLLTSACGSMPDGAPLELHEGAALRAGWTEAWTGEAEAVATASGLRVVFQSEGGFHLLDPVTGDDAWVLEPGATLAAAAGTVGEPLVVLADGALLTGATMLGPATFAGIVQGTVTDVQSDGADLWIATDEALYWLHDDWLHTVATDDGPMRGALAAAGGVAWTAHPEDGVTAVARSSEGWRVIARHRGLVATGVAVDGQDRAWVTTEEGPWVFEGVWRPVDGVGGDTRLFGHPHGLWLVHDEAICHLHEQTLRCAEPPTSLADIDVDEAGRLVMATREGVVRASAERAVVLAGIEEGATLEAAATLGLQVDDPDTLASLVMTLDDDPLDAAGPIRLDARELGVGAHTLQVRATWSDGHEHEVSLGFTAKPAGVATWTDDIAPLYAARCKVCHDNGTETILATPDDWQARIDDVIDAVSAGRMPLGSDPLPDEELDRIIRWKDGGFP